MDPAQGESQGKSLTSKLKAKVKGVKGKVHRPGHKKRQGNTGNNGDSGSDYSSDESPEKPGPETGYNVGGSTPYTTVKNTPLSPPRRETHDRDYAPSSAPQSDRKNSPSDRSGQQPYAISEKEGAPGYGEPHSSPSQPSPGVLGQVKQTVSGAAVAVGSRMGYYTEVDSTPHEQIPTDPNAPTLIEKTKASLGLGKPTDPNAPTAVEKTKTALGLNQPTDPNAPTAVEKTKNALGLNQPTDPNAPTLIEKTKATLGLGPSSPNTAASPQQQQQPGIVNRVSGAVTSLFAGSPKETGEDVQHTFPAHSDNVSEVGDRGVEGATTTTSSTPAYKTTTNY